MVAVFTAAVWRAMGLDSGDRNRTRTWGLADLGSWRRADLGCLALILWMIFLCVAIDEALEGAASCHCFGRLHADPRYTAVFDALCIAVLCVVRPTEAQPVRSPRFRHSRNAVVSVVTTCGIAFGAWSVLRQSRTSPDDAGFTSAGATVLLNPEKWIGKPFVLGRYTDIGGQLDRGEWLVLFYHHDCEHCQRAVPRYLDRSRSNPSSLRGRKLALVEMPPYAPPGEALVPEDAPVPTGKLNESQDWFVTVPLAVVLHDGKVAAVASGDDAEDPDWTEEKPPLAAR